jgi:hypothetical protein
MCTVGIVCCLELRGLELRDVLFFDVLERPVSSFLDFNIKVSLSLLHGVWPLPSDVSLNVPQFVQSLQWGSFNEFASFLTNLLFHLLSVWCLMMIFLWSIDASFSSSSFCFLLLSFVRCCCFELFALNSSLLTRKMGWFGVVSDRLDLRFG